MYYLFTYLYTMKTDFLKNWDTQLKKGLLPLYVLKALSEKEYYGYELIQHLQLVYNTDVTESTIYPLLIRLLKEDLLYAKWVEQPSGIPRKYYQLSAEGKKILKQMVKNIEAVASAIIK
jgi:PadR family transcriptional regulator, regulatory protein PadR